MKKIQQMFLAVILVAAITTFTACNKSFDAPPAPSDPNITANVTIQNLKTYHTVPSSLDLISQDVIISGIVVANDKSGNFYKQLFIQDSTGSIQLQIDATGLYASYPVGRKVYVKCKGLTLSDYYGTMQLGIKSVVGGVASLQGIPGASISNYLIGASLNNPVVPMTVTLSQLGSGLSDRYINSLIQLEDYEFTDTANTYSDTSAYRSTQNRNIVKGCGNTTPVIVRSSAYANFTGVRLPKGNGSIAAIYTVYKSFTGTATKQLIIRDTSDVKFTNPRCGQLPASNISVSSNNLSGFNYLIANGGPSAEKTFTASGNPLTADISITAPANYEISTTSGSGFTNALTLTQVSGSVAPTIIYVRLAAGLSQNTYNGNIVLSSTGTTNQTIACSGSVTTTAPAGPASIASVRALYQGADLKITNSTTITGVVTSDAVNKNISTGAVIIQDGSNAGITIYFGGTITYNIGDSIVLDITNDSLLNYRGSLEIKTTFGTVKPTPVATGRIVTPLVKTIAELNTSLSAALGSPSNLELVLVKVLNATASGGATFSGNMTLTDATANIVLYTSATALFSATALPAGPKNWTGYIKSYFTSTKEFLIRNTTDFQ